MVPLPPPVAEVCALAKRDIAPGETLDQIGEHCYRAWIMTAEEARAQGALPGGLLAGGKATAPIAKGALITHNNAVPMPGSRLAELRAAQDRMLHGHTALEPTHA